MQKLFLEDFAPGQTFASGSLLVDAAQVRAFAEQFDPQPFHLDDAAARTTLFAGLAASGWHTAALTMRLMVESGLPVAGGIIGAGGEIAWPRPLRPGDTIRLAIEVLDIRPSATRPRGRMKVRTTTLNQHDEAVQVLVADLVVPRRPV